MSAEIATPGFEKSPLDTLAIGAAGEFLTCADLIMNGYRAWQAPQSFSYDVIADIEGRLLRFSVKSTRKPTKRPGRVNAKEAYRFHLCRNQRMASKLKSDVRAYTDLQTDIIVVVALDTKQIGYIAVKSAPTTLEIEAPHGLNGSAIFGPRDTKLRSFDSFSLQTALRDIGMTCGEARPQWSASA